MGPVQTFVEMRLGTAGEVRPATTTCGEGDTVGDRGNIAVKQDTGDEHVFLYSHWGGSELPKNLQVALAKKERWDDPPYLARIIFCEMVKGEEDGTTGFGISTGLTDNNHPILEVDTINGQINARLEAGNKLGRIVANWSFDEYVKLSDPGQYVELAREQARR